jgi:hypothetical protein
MKALDQYDKTTGNKDGLRATCKDCRLEKRRMRIKMMPPKPLITEKYCRRCRKIKPIGFFHKAQESKDGYRNFCTECGNVPSRACMNRNKDKHNAYMRGYNKREVFKENRYATELRRKYGVDQELYQEMLLKQDYKCLICTKMHDPKVKKGRLFLDHNHANKKIRGLICGFCNSMLGYAKDDITILLAAIEYITIGNIIGPNDKCILKEPKHP